MREYHRPNGRTACLWVLAGLLLSVRTVTSIEIWQAGGSGRGWASTGTLSGLVVDDLGSLLPAGVDPVRNALKGLKSRGGEIRSPQSRDDLTSILTDGDLDSYWEVTRERRPDGTSMEIDLAAILPINRIRMVGDEETYLRGYQMFVHDGNPAQMHRDRPIAFENLVHSNPEQDDREIDVQIPLQFVRFIKVISITTQEFRIAEAEVFGDGFAPSGQFDSEVIELPGPANFGRIELLTRSDSLARVVLQTRTGSTPDPLIYYYKTEVLQGEERSQLPLIPIGEPEAREAWESLPIEDRGRKEDNVQDWSPWSAPYNDFSGVFASPGNRQHLQFRLIFSSQNVRAAAAVESFSVEFSEPALARSIVGEINPGSIILGKVHSFDYFILPVIGPGNPGFDRIEVETPFLSSVKAVTVDGKDVDYEKQETEDRFSVRLTGERITSGQLLHITFDALATVYGTTFFGKVFDTGSAELGQDVTPGDATPNSSSDRLSVEGELTARLVDNLRVSTVFTPNGDGINDQGEISFVLLRALIPVPVKLTIHDLSGRTVRRLHDQELINGRQRVSWDGLDEGGRRTPPGLYVLKLAVDTDTGFQYETRIVGVTY